MLTLINYNDINLTFLNEQSKIIFLTFSRIAHHLLLLMYMYEFDLMSVNLYSTSALLCYNVFNEMKSYYK